MPENDRLSGCLNEIELEFVEREATPRLLMTPGEDTQKVEVYSSVADQLGISLEQCYRGMYADLEEYKRLVRFGHQVSDEYQEKDGSTTTTRLTGDSEESYAEDTIAVEWLLTRYNLALAQAVLYDVTEMRVQV